MPEKIHRCLIVETSGYGPNSVENAMQKENIETADIVVVIPVYKNQLLDFEAISLQQIYCVLNNYKTVFVCSETLKFHYGELYSEIGIERFDDRFFDGISGYNTLMLSEEFYERFHNYTYMLIAQLDAFVFEDRLLHFANLGYDYIGAPWIHGIRYYKDVNHIIHYIGNGGLSLRKISAFLEWIKKDKDILNKYKEEINEDVLIAAYGNEFLKITSFQDALQFSFDFDPENSFLLNGSKLPFGIHAWNKYDIDFCRPYIEAFGYKVREVDTKQIKEKYDYRYWYEEKRNLYLEGLVSNGKSVIDKFKSQQGGELYLWGTGLWGQLVGRIFNDLEIEYTGFIDNNKKEETMLEHPVFSSSEWEREKKDNSKIVIAVFDASQISEQLSSKGLLHKKDYLSLTDFVNETEKS